MKTQKEIYESINKKFAFGFGTKDVLEEFMKLKRQEAIKECKIMMKDKNWIFTYSKFIIDYLKEYYSITDEELR